MAIQFDVTGLEPAEIKSFEETITELDKCFSIQPEKDFILTFKNFELFKHYSSIENREVYMIADGRRCSYVTFIGVCYNYVGYRGGMYRAEEYQVWASAMLPMDFGHILIKRESLRDSIIDLFHPVEIDFPEDKEFSRQYYVLSSDKERALKLLNQPFRDELKRILIKEFYMEILNNCLIIGNRKLVDKKEALALTSFVFNISELDF